MELRVTTESDTYVYASSTLKIAGLEPEDFVILVFPIAALNTVGVQPLLCLFVGVSVCGSTSPSLLNNRPVSYRFFSQSASGRSTTLALYSA